MGYPVCVCSMAPWGFTKMEMPGATSPQGGQITQIPGRHNPCVRLPRARAIVDGKGGVVREGFMEVAQTEVGPEEREARD